MDNGTGESVRLADASAGHRPARRGKGLRNALAIAAAVAGLAAATSTQAHATTTPAPADASVLATHSMETDDGNPGGRIEFRTLGDVVSVSDQQAGDGFGAIGYVYEYVNSTTRGDRVYSLPDDHADGVPAVASASNGHNLIEGRTYWFRICLIGNGQGLEYCDWAAWSNQE